MRFFLLFLLFCCFSYGLFAQEDRVLTADSVSQTDSIKKIKSSIVRFSIRNRGGKVNGLNVSVGGYERYSKSPNLFRVNGLDVAVISDEARINGLAFALFGVFADTLNGVGCGLFGGGVENGKGLFVYGLVGSSWSTLNGASAAGLFQINTKGNGLALSGISTVYDESFNGLLFSGIYNCTHKNFRGAGISGAVQIFEDAKGFTASGGLTVVNENYSGFLFSGLTSFVGNEFHGVGISAATNRVGTEAHGLLVSAVNTTPVMQGMQIGLVNYANRLQGIQLGLINVNMDNPKGLRVLPFINFKFRPLHETDTIREHGDSCYVLRSYKTDGRIASVSYYRKGKLEGIFTLYNLFNDKVRQTNFQDGLKEGEEFYFDGAGKISESSLYHADTLLWSTSYDYPDDWFPQFVEKTIYYAKGKEEILGLMGTDTLYQFAKSSGYHIERHSQEYGVSFYEVYDRDSLLDIIWIRGNWKSTDFNGPSTDTIIHIRPGQIPSAGIVLSVNVLPYSEPTDWVATLFENPVYKATGQCFPLTINGLDHHRRIVQQLILPGNFASLDSTYGYSFPWEQEFRLFDKKGHVRLLMNDTVTNTFYKSGKIKNRFNYETVSSRNEKVVFIYAFHAQRTDYYKNGVRAFYESQDTLYCWDPKGRLTQFEHGDTVRMYYENGKTEYETSPGTLKYFDSEGQLILYGNGDTIYTFHKGRLYEMLITHNDSTSIVNVTNGGLKYNGSTAHYFRHNGKWIYKLIREEPFIGTNSYFATDGYYNGKWFGDNILLKMSNDHFYRPAKSPSPISLPKWLELYFQAN